MYKRQELSAEEAHAISREGASLTTVELADDRWPQLAAGEKVSITPDDYGAVPVQGELVLLTQHEVALRRVDELAGEVVVHFPRSGYRVEKR